MAISGSAAVATEWTLVTAALVFLVIRGSLRIGRGHKLTLSDFFILGAWLCFVSCCACDTRLKQLGLFTPGRTYDQKFTTVNTDPAKTIEALKIIYGSALPYFVDLWLVKSAFLSFYFELIPPIQRRLRKALWFLTFFTVGSFIFVINLNAFFCEPISSNWSLSTNNQCINCASLTVFFPCVILHILSDLMIYALPFFLLRNLHVSRRQFWGLVSIFSLGGIAVFMSIARIVALALSATTTQVAVWTALECSTAIIVACCPALRGLFRSPESNKSPNSSRGTGNVRHLPGNAQGVDRTNERPREENAAWDDDAKLGLMNENGFVLKNIDFEILSETVSRTSQPSKQGIENWDTTDRIIRM